nr:immunoglobulin heavy chain junction region [Macaca mulatta]
CATVPSYYGSGYHAPFENW